MLRYASLPVVPEVPPLLPALEPDPELDPVLLVVPVLEPLAAVPWLPPLAPVDEPATVVLPLDPPRVAEVVLPVLEAPVVVLELEPLEPVQADSTATAMSSPNRIPMSFPQGETDNLQAVVSQWRERTVSVLHADDFVQRHSRPRVRSALSFLNAVHDEGPK